VTPPVGATAGEPFGDGGERSVVIVADLGDRYQFVTQPDHADLAGQFADHWGGDVDRPEPFESLVVAAYLHDVGWEAHDRRPRLDEDGEPVDFRGMPADPWVPLYEEGVDAVVDLDPYAGLLVSLHGAGLRNRRYGLSPEWPETPPAFEAFVEREERRQRRLLDDLLAGEGGESGNGGGSDTPGSLSAADDATLAAMHDPDRVPENPDGRLWDDYCRLQTWDALSLAFCITDSPPGYGEVGPVPVGGGSERSSVTRVDASEGERADSDGTFTLDPYPFDTAPLVVTVPVRTVRKAAVDGATVGESTGDRTTEAHPPALARAYYGAGRETRSFTLRRRDAPS
jgi:hypothetical protein